MITERLEQLFGDAIELPPSERKTFLERTCASEPELLQRLEAMIETHTRAERLSFFAPKTPSPGSQETGQRIGPYLLREALGEGGWGVVFLAEQEKPIRRRVALKVIKAGLDTRNVIARFDAEREALARMDHPNIAKVLDAGATESGRPYFVMELVSGARITDYCDQKKLGLSDRLELFTKVCQAVQHAHQKGIIHRDLKPSNILVADQDGLAVPKVIDFGIAKATEGRLTEHTAYTGGSHVIGTPAYMSPEQTFTPNPDVDTRSDVYSLGVLLYELLAGRTPFELAGLSWEEMCSTIREQDPVRPSALMSTLPEEERTAIARRRGATAPQLSHRVKGDLDWIVMKCLAKERGRRYETANGLAADLQRHLHNDPVVARPPTAVYKFQRAWRRNKGLYATCLIVAIALVAGVAGTSIGLFRAESASRQLGLNLYFNRIALAHRELTAETPNLKQASELLEACPPRLRNWEWHHLQRRLIVEPLVLPGTNQVNALSFNSDGTLLASGGVDRDIRIWDSASGKMVQQLAAHAGAVVCVAFDPVNPALIASAGLDDKLTVWNWKSRQKLYTRSAAIPSQNGMAYSVAFSADGRLLAAPATNGEVVVRATATGEEVSRFSGAGAGQVTSVAFSQEGHLMATGSSQGTVRLWDLGKEPATGADFSTAGPPVSAVSFSQHGRILAACYVSRFVKPWDTRTHREISSFRFANLGLPTGFTLFPEGDRVFSGSSDSRLVTVSELSTGREVLVFRELARGSYCVAFNPHSTRLAAACGDGTVHVWDGTPHSRYEDPSLEKTLKYRAEQVWGLDVSPDGRSIFMAGGSGANERAPVLACQGAEFGIRNELASFAIVVFSIAADPLGRLLAFCGDDSPRPPGRAPIKVLDIKTSGRESFLVEPFEGDQLYFSVAFSPNGEWLAGGAADGQVHVWNAATGRKAGLVGRHDNQVTKVIFSGDSRYLASIGRDDEVKVWDSRRLGQIQRPRTLKAQCDGYSDLIAFSPDGARLAVVTDDSTARIYNLSASDDSVSCTERGHRPIALALSPDGRWLASGGEDCAVKIWDAQTGKPLRTFRSHLGPVVRLRFMPTPQRLRLVSGSYDGTVKIWNLARLEDNSMRDERQPR